MTAYEKRLAETLDDVSPFDLNCKLTDVRFKGEVQEEGWFRHPSIPNVVAKLGRTDGGKALCVWILLKVNGPYPLTAHDATEAEVRYIEDTDSVD